MKNNNKNTTISAGNNKYLGQFMTELPQNCLFNKVITGCGGTTIALTNKEDYVIAVPFKNLITNKVEQHDNVLGVHGDVTDNEIRNYFNRNAGANKIMVTYDSIERVMKVINPSEYRLLVDESHKLIDSGSFRGTAISRVMNNYKSFKSYTFMTATPVKDKYQHPSIKMLDKVSIKWDNIEPVTINYQLLDSNFNKKIASLIISYIEGELKGNPYFFINSVTSIISIIKLLKKAGYDSAELFKIIIADNDDNEYKIQKNLGKHYRIEKPSDANKKITFITSTCFEGADFFDEDGITYILTDGSKDHTKIDILTCMPQIIGRLRDSKYNRQVNIMFTRSPYYSYTTEEQFEKYVKDQLEEAKYYIEAMNNDAVPQMIKDTLIEGSKTNAFLIERNNVIVVNNEAWYSEMHNFEALHTTYYVYKNENGQLKQRSDTHIEYINETPYNYRPCNNSSDLTLLDKIKLNEKVKFSEIAERYCIEREEGGTCLFNKTSFVISVDNDSELKVIKKAYDELGAKKIKALKFRKTDIQKELLKVNSVMSNEYKIVRTLGLRTGQFITCKDAKNAVQCAYNELGINKKAKGSDLCNWYDVESKNRRIDGKNTKGYVIILNKIK